MRVTGPMLKVLDHLLAAPGHRAYGLEIMDATGISSGTMYPLLMRLHDAGWLTSQKEDIDPSAEGRPARNYFTLTGEGAHEARLLLLDHTPRSVQWT
jgi:PadR family transcriptional regulator PadR